ncbi:unnamed protein product [Paramecium sonneborni]|uniref:Uncharacterized protein n=1 Tax=Paramecium sonneborni TaxID=65129 RepID=A0A8S1RN91_9CILI|nr:unnamed protein product [Paramecium sonneborni]
MIISGTISYLFGQKPIPLRVKINRVIDYYYQEDKELFLNQCEIYDGEQKATIYIEHQFKLNSQNVQLYHPLLEIIQFKKEKEKVIVEKFLIEKFNEFEINLDKYVLNQEFQYVDGSQIDQELKGKQYYNVKAVVIKINLRKTNTGSPYLKVQIAQHITQHQYIVIIFENRFNGFQTINLKEGEDYIFYNIKSEIYEQQDIINTVFTQGEIRLYVEKITKIDHIKQELKYVDFNIINYQNSSKYYDFLGYTLKINTNNPQYQILTLISIQKVKVYVLIPNQFCKLISFGLQQDKFYGFKNVKIIKYSYRFVLLFNGQSSLIPNLNILPKQKFQRQDFLQYTKLQVQLKCSSLEDLKSDFIDKKFYYIKAEIQSIKMVACQNKDQVNLDITFSNSQNCQIIVRVDIYKHIVKILSLEEYIKDTSAKAFNLLTNRLQEHILKNALGDQIDCIVQGLKSDSINEKQSRFRMVKIFQITNLKKIKQE